MPGICLLTRCFELSLIPRRAPTPSKWAYARHIPAEAMSSSQNIVSAGICQAYAHLLTLDAPPPSGRNFPMRSSCHRDIRFVEQHITLERCILLSQSPVHRTKLEKNSHARSTCCHSPGQAQLRCRGQPACWAIPPGELGHPHWWMAVVDTT